MMNYAKWIGIVLALETKALDESGNLHNLVLNIQIICLLFILASRFRGQRERRAAFR